MTGTATAKCFLKLHWQDDSFLTTLQQKIKEEKAANAEERLVSDLGAGKLVKGMQAAGSTSLITGLLPVNINLLFQNQVKVDVIDSLCWTKYIKPKGGVEKGLVSVSGCVELHKSAQLETHIFPYVLDLLTSRAQVQIVADVTVYAPMNLTMYPFDRHVVPFCVETKSSDTVKWTLCKKWPDWAPKRYDEDKVMLAQMQTTPDLEYNHKRCYVHMRDRGAILCVLIDRDPNIIMIRTVMPVFLVVCIALAVTGVQSSDSSDNEYNATSTSLLTLTGLYYTVQQSLPKQSKPYLAWPDIYFMARPSLLHDTVHFVSFSYPI